VDTTTVAYPPTPDTRELRALALYRERSAEIVRTGPHTYEVPSCSGRGPYAVDYERETCDCPDARRHPALNCKHLLAVAVQKAKRRGASARLLAKLEDRHRHGLMDPDERCELGDVISRLRRKLGL
jgi:hypothetical protein